MNIDYLILYVDSSDPAWRLEYSKYEHLNKQSKKENKRRFDGNILFKYQFRGIEKYMPWINRVFLVV